MLAIKHIHMTVALLSIFLFVIRFFWRFSQSAMMEKKWVKIVPHINDTILLISAFALAFSFYPSPFSTGWIVEKLILVVAYILIGVYTLKKAKTTLQQGIGFLAALAVLAQILNLAMNKMPLVLPVTL